MMIRNIDMSEIDTNVVQIKRGVGKKELIGSTTPRIHTPLLKGATKSEEVAQLAEKIGIPLIPWQRWVLDDLLTIDDEVTSRFYGFKNRYDYYYNASCYHRIPHIRVPTLFLNALDDPILGHKLGADAFF